MSELGGFYAAREDHLAAAGLLSAAYHLRRDALGPDHRDTLDAILSLGPVYVALERFEDAEQIYQAALSAQERVKGANNPELSLYLRFLGRIYEHQGRLTQAEALYKHVGRLFRDAFGERRYDPNRDRDRTSDINRPVSVQFPIPADYAPNDLVPAGDYGAPLSKWSDSPEMHVRLAADAQAAESERGASPRTVEDELGDLPSRLAMLIQTCAIESGERLSLRSGYRSYRTQRVLYERNGASGRVTPPGLSEHQLGLAVDIDVDGRFMRQTDRAFRCFERTAFRYGFIMSYPPGSAYLPGGEVFEPWHWRYVGVETARLYREAGPLNKPMEFLAALPCYEERARAGMWRMTEDEDVCLDPDAAVAPPAMAAVLQPVGPEETGSETDTLNAASLNAIALDQMQHLDAAADAPETPEGELVEVAAANRVLSKIDDGPSDAEKGAPLDRP